MKSDLLSRLKARLKGDKCPPSFPHPHYRPPFTVGLDLITRKVRLKCGNAFYALLYSNHSLKISCPPMHLIDLSLGATFKDPAPGL
jgi:hypothetical protein